ncbi:Peptidoglycan/xylan/chitin deacetylase, PgdA/CDA1 family [Bacillus sp. cl95]|nr:Peptidoglycan/xylan/chitin deacetylase, PgdA/CDA1 family [Bacillus sp. cl95]
MYDSDVPSIMTKAETNGEKQVILTFDDGPSRVLPQILDILKAEKVPAIFFWQSRLLYPQREWKRVFDEGHQIGTHSTKHVNLTQLSYEKQYYDIKNSVDKMERTIGKKVTLFRPPFGQFNDDTLAVAKELQLQVVMWRLSSFDWELANNPQQIIEYIVDHLEDGAIILLHELRQTVSVLPQLIQAIREKGYGFGTLEK